MKANVRPFNCSLSHDPDKRWLCLGCNNNDKQCYEPCEFNQDIPRECISNPDDMANFIRNKIMEDQLTPHDVNGE
jgi:hypothetical protein